jgi:hypothetical protein
MDFSTETWNILERNTFHPNMLAFLENVLFKLTKVAIVSHVKFNFESKVYYEFDFIQCLILFQLQKIN